MKEIFPILVVDDDIVSRAVVQKYLHKAGFEVVCAGNGKEALTLLEEQFCPIVLTDWMMPEINGPELCRLIREKQTVGYIFIILMSARDSKNDIVSGLESGADDYLTKPVHPAELVARIKTGIRILSLEQSLRNANEEIRILSITDPLTGCYNRTYLGERFAKELSRSQRYKHPLSVLLADIDFFKKVNDTYGHQAGDIILKEFSKCIMAQVREDVDWVVRFGGEEFLIVLPETDCIGATVVAERLRSAINQLGIPCEQATVHITASFGGASACFTQRSDLDITVEQLIDRADEQLYRAKREGRNRVHVTETLAIAQSSSLS
jgi:diguanylate cyclase (GGDEF)-like protein